MPAVRRKASPTSSSESTGDGRPVSSYSTVEAADPSARRSVGAPRRSGRRSDPLPPAGATASLSSIYRQDEHAYHHTSSSATSAVETSPSATFRYQPESLTTAQSAERDKLPGIAYFDRFIPTHAFDSARPSRPTDSPDPFFRGDRKNGRIASSASSPVISRDGTEATSVPSLSAGGAFAPLPVASSSASSSSFHASSPDTSLAAPTSHRLGSAHGGLPIPSTTPPNAHCEFCLRSRNATFADTQLFYHRLRRSNVRAGTDGSAAATVDD